MYGKLLKKFGKIMDEKLNRQTFIIKEKIKVVKDNIKVIKEDIKTIQYSSIPSLVTMAGSVREPNPRLPVSHCQLYRCRRFIILS